MSLQALKFSISSITDTLIHSLFFPSSHDIHNECHVSRVSQKKMEGSRENEKGKVMGSEGRVGRI